MGRADASRQRCAIYTRKSSEEGLEQEFNSLAAQNRANPTSVGGAIGLGQDAQLVLGSERPSPRAIGEFG